MALTVAEALTISQEAVAELGLGWGGIRIEHAGPFPVLVFTFVMTRRKKLHCQIVVTPSPINPAYLQKKLVSSVRRLLQTETEVETAHEN